MAMLPAEYVEFVTSISHDGGSLEPLNQILALIAVPTILKRMLYHVPEDSVNAFVPSVVNEPEDADESVNAVDDNVSLYPLYDVVPWSVCLKNVEPVNVPVPDNLI